MARDKTDRTPAATWEPTETEKQAWLEQFEPAAAKKAKEYLAGFSGMRLAPGGVTLFSIGIRFKDIDEVRYPVVSDKQLEILLKRAESDYDAYLGAKYIARLWMARRTKLPAPLLRFVLNVLSGNEMKPKAGRNRAKDTQLRAFMYAWALFIQQRPGIRIPLVRNEVKKGIQNEWSACDMVARAFSQAGKHTTYQQVKSYCYDQSYWHVRAAASLMWQTGREYADTGREFDFDLDAFCFGKP